jgi:magnesium-transporting ATPase (P-type)
MLALAQLAFLFNARFLNSSSLTPRVLVGNRAIWIGAGVLLVLEIAFAYAPFMNDWFGSAPIGLRDWGISLGLAILVFLLAEAGKALVRRTAPARSTR